MTLPAILLPIGFIATLAALFIAVEKVSLAEDAARPRPLTLIAFAP